LCASLFALLLMPLTGKTDILTIDFESVPAGGCLNIGDSFTTQGFDFSTEGSNFFSCNSTRSDLPSNETNYVGSESPSITTMAATDGATFSLISIDLAELFVGREGYDDVRIDGILLGGGTATSMFTLDGVNDGPGGEADFETFLLSGGFSNLTSIVLTATDSSNPRFSFDNIVVDTMMTTSVPEPGTLALLGVGLAGIGFARKRKTA